MPSFLVDINIVIDHADDARMAACMAMHRLMEQYGYDLFVINECNGGETMFEAHELVAVPERPEPVQHADAVVPDGYSAQWRAADKALQQSMRKGKAAKLTTAASVSAPAAEPAKRKPAIRTLF